MSRSSSMHRRARAPWVRPLALLLACAMATPLWAAPGDITAVPAPTIGADPPKAHDIHVGDASVSTQTGAVTYSYPITVPPGRLGMQPSLALAYSSQAPVYGGIAAGWSLDIPEIRRDTSRSWLLQTSPIDGSPDWQRERFVSSLAGERPLVMVTEPTGKAADVLATYRAQNDTGFDRYERGLPGEPFRWRVRSHSGVTHFFGEPALAPGANDRWSPLTRTVDPFGNTVEYQWDGTRILQIRYTSNPQATPALLAFARVDFVWSPTAACPGDNNALGRGEVDDRRLGIVRGGVRLDRIRATAFAPGTPVPALHTREITLAYAATAEACDGKHGPFLQLQQIEESAWGDTEPSVKLPAVTFTYNRLERTFDQAVANTDVDLGWGTRDGEWPTVESMLLDFDGDGLQDQLYMVDRDQCTFGWKKNLGRTGNGVPAFGAPSTPMVLPKLPWKTGTRGTNEWCALSGQYTELVNTTPTNPNCVGAHTMLAYRWIDPNDDGLPDLVTAIHTRGPFDANLQGYFGAWPSCTAQDTAACIVPEGNCFSQITTCPLGSTGGTCRLSAPALTACLATAPRASCDVVVAWASQLPEAACVTNCTTTRACAPTSASCLADCEHQCGAGAIFRRPFPSIAAGCDGQFGSPVHEDRTACLSLATTPPTPPTDCGAVPSTAQRRCGRYPWMIYDNQGGGTLAGLASASPRIVYQPVPLESDSGDSSFGGEVAATNHGIIDVDGDGLLDAVVRGTTYTEAEAPTTTPPTAWHVYPGDGAGGFITGTPAQAGTDLPALYVWLTGGDAPVSGSGSLSRTGAPSPDDFDNRGLSTVVDLTGDGAPDYVWKTADPFAPRDASTPPDQVNAELRLLRGNGVQFEFGMSNDVMTTPLLSATSDVKYLSRSLVDASAWSGDAVIAAARTNRARLIDIDADGRPDAYHTARLDGGSGALPVWGTPTLRINGGGGFLPTSALSTTWLEALRQESRAYQGASMAGHPAGRYWETTRDLVDLDGDGLPEAWTRDGSVYGPVYRDTDRQPLRLLKTVNNGRGGVVTIDYAASTDAATVTQDAALRKAMPHTQWVVRTMTTNDAWDAGDAATTQYAYKYPAWKPDDAGRWGFRGFEEVTTTAPSGAKTVDTYGFDVDWSGRLKARKTYPAEDPANLTIGAGSHPSSMREVYWAPFSLFGGAITTYHTLLENSWTCSNGQTEAACKAADAGRIKKFPTWTTLGGQLHVATGGFQQAADVFGIGDRRTLELSTLVSDATNYRLRTDRHWEFVAVDGHPENDTMVNYHDEVYDPSRGNLLQKTQYFSATPSTKADTVYDYDPAGSGVLVNERRPNQQAKAPLGPQIVHAYDPTRRFVISRTDEKGFVVTSEYEPGTGATVASAGPNLVPCGAGCFTDQTWTDVDGLGRPLATYVNHATGAGPWLKTKVSTTAYVDAPQGSLRPNVVSQQLIDYAASPARWTREETRLDSRGRPVQVLIKTGATSPDAVTTYDYDARGNLASVTLPDPSAAVGSVATVAYSYTYDSLSRPTSMRRPAITGAASGVDMSYNGLVTQSDEIAGGQGGPAGRKVLINDRYGRLSEVREYTDLAAGTFAPTLYKYDAHDAINWIQNADGVVTVLVHDFAGRRVRIDRAGRSWTYDYDRNGNLVSEQFPAPSLMAMADYANAYGYDELDRMTTRTVGGRMLSSANKDLLGIGEIVFGYDGCANGVGRLCAATLPFGRLTSTYAYDAEGNQATETRAFSLAGVTGTRTTGLSYGPGGRVVEQTYADNAVGATKQTKAQYAYDDRGLPIGVGWVPAPGGQVVRQLADQVRNVAGQVLTRKAMLTGPPTGSWRTFTSAWGYDKISRVTSQTVNDSAAVQHAKQVLTYHGLDDPKTLQHVLGVATGPTYNFTYGYDPRHQLTTVTEGAGKYLADFQFTLGGKLAGANIRRGPGIGAATGSEMTVRNVTYAYSSPVDPEAPSALVTASTGVNLRSYTYDTVGNLMDRRTGAAPPTDGFLYDGDDQLRRASKYATSGALSGTEEYYYDHAGQRAAVVTRSAANAVTAVRLFMGDTELELNPTNSAVLKAYAHLSLGTPVARIVSPAGGWTTTATNVTAPATVELMYQGLSSNTLVSILPTGAVQAGFVYGPYGDVIQTQGTTGGLAGLRRRFNDKFRDDQTGLQYYGARYYDGLMLGWTQADPLYRFRPDAAWGEPRRANLYQFVLGNPLRYYDPDGRDNDDMSRAVADKLGWGCFGRPCRDVLDESKEIHRREVAAKEHPTFGKAVAAGAAAGLILVGGEIILGTAGAEAVVGGTAAVVARSAPAVESGAEETVAATEGATITLYRGVRPDMRYSQFRDAMRGIVRPIGGHSDPLAHQQGDTASIFTSWTTDFATARIFASMGDATGIVLKAEVPVSMTRVGPIDLGEHERLVVGVVDWAKRIW